MAGCKVVVGCQWSGTRTSWAVATTDSWDTDHSHRRCRPTSGGIGNQDKTRHWVRGQPCSHDPFAHPAAISFQVLASVLNSFARALCHVPSADGCFTRRMKDLFDSYGGLFQCRRRFLSVKDQSKSCWCMFNYQIKCAWKDHGWENCKYAPFMHARKCNIFQSLEWNI